MKPETGCKFNITATAVYRLQQHLRTGTVEGEFKKFESIQAYHRFYLSQNRKIFKPSREDGPKNCTLNFSVAHNFRVSVATCWHPTAQTAVKLNLQVL